MKQRVFLFVIIAFGIVSAAQLATIVISSSPYTASKGTLWTFFICLYLVLTTWGSLIWFGIRKLLRKRNVHLFPSLRQAGLVSMIICLSLFFRTLNIFTVWDVAPLAIAAILIEFFFQAEKKPQATLEYDVTA